MPAQPDLDGAHELSLWATTSSRALYDQSVKPVCLNIARKQLAGTYDASKALKLWEGVADNAAKLYLKEFAPQIAAGDWDTTVFNVATRRLVAVSIGEQYEELTRDILDDLRTERDNRKRWTLAAIKDANEAGGGYFFSRDTQRFFGDVMGNFAVRCEGAAVYVVRTKAPRNAEKYGVTGRAMIGQRRLFDPETGAIGGPIGD